MADAAAAATVLPTEGPLCRTARAVRHSGPSVGRTVAAAAASAMCGAMVCGLADFLWNYPRVLVIFWFTFAMAIAGVKVCTEEAK